MIPAPKSLRLIAAACFLAGTTQAASADQLPIPAGEIILTVSGNIENTNAGDTAQFDREMLDALGLVDITTATPWYDGVVTFSGVPVANLLELVAAEGETITALALNDYEVKIPVSDAWDTGVILATRLNGEEMTVRNKGPIFVIYPYDSDDDLKSQTYYARSAWQVNRLIIR
ncbi:molybdopterin-dependent oxidoreductase [Roseovarius sp. D0-M9]|uniref:molybdopterin-dependent oxidoreductase n=1 Tax=Roseovarius sp. D0-M9 TaxID=3127117 RepID=UPI00300FFDE4